MIAILPDVVAQKKQVDQSAEPQAATELVRLVKGQGLSLTGPDGLLKQLTEEFDPIDVSLQRMCLRLWRLLSPAPAPWETDYSWKKVSPSHSRGDREHSAGRQLRLPPTGQVRGSMAQKPESGLAEDVVQDDPLQLHVAKAQLRLDRRHRRVGE
jgi:hypothetical protein